MKSPQEKSFVLALVFDREHRLGADVRNLERPVFHVTLHISISKLAANQALGIKDGVVGVPRTLR